MLGLWLIREARYVALMVVLDELCSGTNPSEGTEVFAMVREAGRRYQDKRPGRLHHAARQARYRAEHKKVMG